MINMDTFLPKMSDSVYFYLWSLKEKKKTKAQIVKIGGPTYIWQVWGVNCSTWIWKWVICYWQLVSSELIDEDEIVSWTIANLFLFCQVPSDEDNVQ